MKHFASIGLATAILAAFIVAGNLNERLLAERASEGINQAQPLENSPPLVAFTTVALGGFRGLLADMLWVRASTLQDEGRYFELVQLADWITKLEPKFAVVWAYQSWNMSYNISVLFNDPADRWRWVRNGIHLLRDEGMVYNPGDHRLYRELGWLFQHKIGMPYDQAHLYYKKAWADEMMNLLGTPDPDWPSLPLATLRRLQQDYKIDPQIALDMDRRIGALDWRLAQTHAIYWAWAGRRWARGFEAIMLDRMILQCMGDIFRSGRWIEPPKSETIVFAPRPDYLPVVRREYERAIAAIDPEYQLAEAFTQFKRGAILTLVACHREPEALAVLRELPPEEARLGLERFVYENTLGAPDQVQPAAVRDTVLAALDKSRSWRRMGEGELAAGYERLAEICWNSMLDDLRSGRLASREKMPRFETLRKDFERNARQP